MTDLSIPDHLPVADAIIPEGWTQVGLNELVRTQDHYFSFFKTPPQWVLGAFYTSDAYLNGGKQTYARPSCLRAKLSVLLPVIRKVVRRWRS
jgi:hypothetical protein